MDGRQAGQLAEYALRLAVLRGDPRWVRWVTETLKTVDYLPMPETIHRLADARALPGVGEMVADVVRHWRQHRKTLSNEELASLARLDELARDADVGGN